MVNVPLGHCAGCGEPIAATGPAVQPPPRARWEPFLEDGRSSATEFMHVNCFVEANGIDALVEAVHREDLRRPGRHEPNL